MNKEYILYVARFFALHCCPKATVYRLRGARGNAKKEIFQKEKSLLNSVLNEYYFIPDKMRYK